MGVLDAISNRVMIVSFGGNAAAEVGRFGGVRHSRVNFDVLCCRLGLCLLLRYREIALTA